MALVRLRGPLKRLAGDRAEHSIDGGSVGELLAELERSHPAAKGWILDERGVLRRHINVFVNGELVGQDTEVGNDDRVEVLPAISGGSLPPMLASVDGNIGPSEEARIPVTDEGLTRGDGGFEVMRLYGGRPFALPDHFARLGRTCAGLRLDYDEEALQAEIAALLDASGPVEALLRVVLTRGGHRILTIEPLPERLPVARVATVTYAPNRVLDGLKTLSYAGNMLAGRLARERGFDEALLVTPHGRVLEGPTWTFFWVAGGRLLTPPLEDRILDSITRRYVLEECDAQEQPCTLDDVAAAEEAFIASTVRECMPIATVDDIAIPAAPGPVTVDAGERLARRIERELASATA
jgi:branched-chain amino acid aminotransferase